MVIDSSAVVALLTREAEHRRLADVIDADKRLLLSSVNYYESLLVMRTRKTEGVRLVDEFVSIMRVEVVPFNKTDALAAFAAFQRYGRGYSPARLNLGDCAAYALAERTNEPLLYKGGDFALTGIRSVEY